MEAFFTNGGYPMMHFGLIGHPLGHTLSPWIHRQLFALGRRDASYEAMDIAPEHLSSRMPELLGLDGFNVTIPHKQAVIPLLSGLSQRAALYGAVNTVSGGIGYNTDCLGFLQALQGGGIALSGKAAVLGAGGASRVFAMEAALAGCDVTIAGRLSSLPKARALAEEVAEKVPGAQVSFCDLEELRGPFDVLINGTPAGMFPNTDACPVSYAVIGGCAAVFDAVYNPTDTVLLQKAKASGAKAVGGMPMLVWQAAKAQEIWFHTAFDAKEVDALIPEATAELGRGFGR